MLDRFFQKTNNDLRMNQFLNKIIHGDCLEVMKDLPSKSCDMILCDLPFGVTSRNKWDEIIPFEPLWEQYERVIKNNGAIVLTAAQPFTSSLIMSNPKMFKYCWYWEKETPTNFLNANFQPLRVIEDICVFSNGKMSWTGRTNAMMYNPLGLIEVNKKNKRGSSGSNYTHAGKENIQKYTNYPRNLLRYKSDKEKLHPTQKPAALFEYLIKTYTNEGETILDNCIGSGTTAIACLNLEKQGEGRFFIGIEKEKEYVDLANKRIEDHMQQLNI